MGRPSMPALPASGSTNWYSWAQDIDTAIRTENAALRPLSSFAGATDDAKLGTAMAYAAEQTYKPTIFLDECKNYSFSTKRTLFSGFALVGGGARSVDQGRSSSPIPQKVTVAGSAMFAPPVGNCYGVFMQGLSLDGAAGRGFIDGHEPDPNDGILWTSVFRDISAQNLDFILGSKTKALSTTAICCDGWWNVNNILSGGRLFNLAGSDCFIAPSQMLVDTNAPVASEYLLEMSYQSKTHVSNLYVTAHGTSALRISGNDSNGFNFLHNSTIEGRHADEPCPGSLIRIQGGSTMIRDCWTSFAMADPASTGRTDAGVIHITSGQVVIDGLWYERAIGVAETVPLVYATGSGTKVRVRDCMGVGSWTGLPRVQAANGAVIDADNSVTVI